MFNLDTTDVAEQEQMVDKLLRCCVETCLSSIEQRDAHSFSFHEGAIVAFGTVASCKSGERIFSMLDELNLLAAKAGTRSQ